MSTNSFDRKLEITSIDAYNMLLDIYQEDCIGKEKRSSCNKNELKHTIKLIKKCLNKEKK